MPATPGSAVTPAPGSPAPGSVPGRFPASPPGLPPSPSQLGTGKGSPTVVATADAPTSPAADHEIAEVETAVDTTLQKVKEEKLGSDDDKDKDKKMPAAEQEDNTMPAAEKDNKKKHKEKKDKETDKEKKDKVDKAAKKKRRSNST